MTLTTRREMCFNATLHPGKESAEICVRCLRDLLARVLDLEARVNNLEHPKP